MREILFRGKDNGVLNNQWQFGSVDFTNENFPQIIRYDRFRNKMFIPVDCDTVGQFTGLTDKNGKKIFEGDIGRYKQTDGAKQNGNPIICTGKVIYNTKTTSYAVESKDETGCKYFDYFPIKDFEVIGNIHDNPELLEVTDNA